MYFSPFVLARWFNGFPIQSLPPGFNPHFLYCFKEFSDQLTADSRIIDVILKKKTQILASFEFHRLQFESLNYIFPGSLLIHLRLRRFNNKRLPRTESH